MAISSIQAASGITTMGGGAVAPTSTSFASSLASQQYIEAARAVLEALPAPIVYSLRDNPGSPSEAVDRLFAVLKDGSFQPPAGPLGRPESIIGATAHAASLFESPAQLWDAMRGTLGGAMASPGFLGPTTPAAGPEPAAPLPEVRSVPEVHTLAEAEQLLADLRAHPTGHPAALARSSADWWEAALRFLLGPHSPA